MRAAGAIALFLGLFVAVGGIAYASFVALREWSVLAEQPIAPAGKSTVRVAGIEGKPTWAAIELEGSVRKTPVEHDIAMKARVIDAAGALLRATDVRLDANAKLPVCSHFTSSSDPACAVFRLEGRARDRIRLTLQIAPMIATKTGDLVYEIDVGNDVREGVTVEAAKVIVYRSSRDEAMTGLLVAVIGLVLGGAVFRMTRRE